MELELGLKITKTKDDIASISEYQLAIAGPVFQSRETNTMFILTAHLKGYKKNNIDIKISKGGNKISISGEKPIQEMVMMGWVMHRKMVDVTGFNKVFRIPDGVNLDRIKAKYDEEEWTLNIVMPKLAKGICGARIEEVKEEAFDRGSLELEKSETDHVSSSSVGETSQKGSKEYEVQGMEGSESIMEKKEEGIAEKMLDEASKETNIETVQKEVGESKLGIEDGNGESVREKGGKEEYEVMKTPELEKNVGPCFSLKIEGTSQHKESEEVQKMDSRSVEKKEGGVSDKKLNDASEDKTEGTIKREKEESKLRIEDGNIKGMREKVGKETYDEAMKTSEIEQDVGAGIPLKIGDASRDKEFEVREMEEKGSVVEKEKMVDDSNVDIIEEMVQKEIEKSKLGIEEGDRESVKEKVGKEGSEAVMSSELEQNVVHHIPTNIGGTSQKYFKESRIQQMEKTKSNEGKMDGGEFEKTPVEANKDIHKPILGDAIQKEIIMPKIETEDGDQEYVREKPGKEGFDTMISIREEFPKHLPKTSIEESEGLNVQKMQETKDVKEEMVKRKGKEIEYLVEKGEGERPQVMHVEAKKDITRETMQEETEKSESGIKESGQQHVRDNTVKGRFERSKSITEELPKQVEEHDGSKRFEVEKEEEEKEVIKEAMNETESLVEKEEGEESRKRTEEATSRVIDKSTVTETLQKKTEESNIERKARDGPHVGEFEVLGTVQEKLPKQVVEAIAQDEKDKMDSGIVKLKGEGSIEMHVEPNEAFEEDTTGDRIEKEIRKKKLKSSDQLSGKESVDNRIFDGRERQKFPEREETEDLKEEGAKLEEFVKKEDGDKHEKVQVEENEGFRKDITRETTQKEIEDAMTQRKEKDERRLHEEMSKGRFQASKDAKEEFPMKMVDSPANTREGLKDAKMEKTEGIKEEGAEIEQFVKKVKGEKYEKIQVEGNEGLRNDVTKETARKEAKEPKILVKVKDQQCLQEEMSKGRYEASTTAREFPLQIVDSLAKTRDGPKDKEIEGAEEVKGEVAKRKSEETKVVESKTKEKIEVPESERSTQILHEVPKEKHPKSLEIGTPERELQSAKGPATCAKVGSMGLKDVEQGGAKDKKQKTKLLPAKIQSKETHESKDEIKNQDILKPKKTKEVEEQCTYNTASTKEVATMEDQVVKPFSAPRFPSTQQSEVEEEKDKLYKGSKAKYEASLESQKEDPTKDMQNLIEMKEDQEAKQKETLKPEIPLEKQLKKGGQVIRKGEFHKGQKVGQTMQAKTEGPKKEIDDRDQQYVARDVGKRVGKVETIEKEISKEYAADAGPIAERMETKRGLKTTLEREECITIQNVNDEKPKIQGEIIKADIEKMDKTKCIPDSMKITQEKEHPIKSEVVEKEEESLEASSSLPSVTSMGVKEARPKNEIAEPHQKELSPLTAEMKSKELLELEKPVMQWKFPKTKVHVPVPEPRDKKQHDYGTEDIKAPKMAAYQGTKPSKLQRPRMTQQSKDEENRKSENVTEAREATKESPTMNIVEAEEIDSLQPQVLENQRIEEQKVDGKEEALDQCEFQGSKILIEDKNQQYVLEDNDKKGYQTPKDVEEDLLKREHKAEIVMKKREGPKVAKSEEAKDAARLKRERGKTSQTAEEKKPKMKEITPKSEKGSGFKQVAEKMHETQEREHQRESEEVTSKMGVEVESPTIEKTPNEVVERKEPHELTWPTMDYEIPKIEEVQQEKEGERHIHAPEATISKEKGLAQASATHSKAKSNVEPKGEIDKPQDEFSMKDDSKEESLEQERGEKEPLHSKEGTAASKVVADKGAPQPSKFSSSSCTQQLELEGEDNKTDSSSPNQESQEAKKKDSKIDVQESSTKIEKGQEVEEIETLQPESPADQQCIDKDREERHGIDKIILLEDEKEGKEEASGGKKEEKKMSKKVFVPLVMAGSAILVTAGVIFVRNRRAKKRN